MVLHAADDDGLAIAVLQDAANVAVQFPAQGRVVEKGLSVFGGEDRVHQDFCERFRHGRMLPKSGA